VADPVKLFFFTNEEFFAAKIGHLIINYFFNILKTLKLNSENRKTKKKVF